LLANFPVGEVKKRASWFTRPAQYEPSAYSEFIQSQGKELEPYPWSGYVLALETFTLLEEHSLVLDDLVDDDLTANLRSKGHVGDYVFRRSGAERLVDTLEHLKITNDDINEFLEANATFGYETAPIQAVRDGIDILTKWLSQVDDAHVGLLTIG
jgi:hypothetical protein